ncbi:hypothetical protein CSB08_00215 [Candidatus Gracilibacteria bacterium]|nr:MAG: hypothetical protein CSB08_00215 [Candidatus Gracilibacteria bacterium]PIE85268.1 MAG: hypothetical protein CSA08_02565 [Candidatus Gracilibacteria bacterium]
MKENNAGFTLVELIVVISILAILGTIAFLSFQGYSAEARNSKRISNLGNVSEKIIFETIQGVKIKSLVKDRTNTLSGHVYGGVDSILGDNYDAGTINFDAIGVNEENFLDPLGNKYIIGISTKFLGSFELAASMEKNGTFVGKIVGTYNPRKSALTESSIGSGFGEKIIFLNKNNGLRQGDKIITDGASPATLVILGLSTQNSGHRASLDGIVPADATKIKLLMDDTQGLIADKDDDTKVVSEGGTFLPY